MDLNLIFIPFLIKGMTHYAQYQNNESSPNAVEKIIVFGIFSLLGDAAFTTFRRQGLYLSGGPHLGRTGNPRRMKLFCCFM
jgi:hypothetical protein